MSILDRIREIFGRRSDASYGAAAAPAATQADHDDGGDAHAGDVGGGDFGGAGGDAGGGDGGGGGA